MRDLQHSGRHLAVLSTPFLDCPSLYIVFHYRLKYTQQSVSTLLAHSTFPSQHASTPFLRTHCLISHQQFVAGTTQPCNLYVWHLRINPPYPLAKSFLPETVMIKDFPILDSPTISSTIPTCVLTLRLTRDPRLGTITSFDLQPLGHLHLLPHNSI